MRERPRPGRRRPGAPGAGARAEHAARRIAPRRAAAWPGGSRRGARASPNAKTTASRRRGSLGQPSAVGEQLHDHGVAEAEADGGDRRAAEGLEQAVVAPAAADRRAACPRRRRPRRRSPCSRRGRAPPRRRRPRDRPGRRHRAARTAGAGRRWPSESFGALRAGLVQVAAPRAGPPPHRRRSAPRPTGPSGSVSCSTTASAPIFSSLSITTQRGSKALGPIHQHAARGGSLRAARGC